MNDNRTSKEYIYILTNESMPGLVKIGRTTKSPEERCSEISSATGVPHPFVVTYAMEVTNSMIAEVEIHEFLSDYRVRKQREFFRIEAGRAEAAVKFVGLKYQDSNNFSSDALFSSPQEEIKEKPPVGEIGEAIAYLVAVAIAISAIGAFFSFFNNY